MGQKVRADSSADSTNLKKTMNLKEFFEAEWTHRMEALHLSAGLAIDMTPLPLLLIDGGDVWAPQGSQVQDRHQVLLALGRYRVQVTHQPSAKGMI